LSSLIPRFEKSSGKDFPHIFSKIVFRYFNSGKFFGKDAIIGSHAAINVLQPSKIRLPQLKQNNFFVWFLSTSGSSIISQYNSIIS